MECLFGVKSAADYDLFGKPVADWNTEELKSFIQTNGRFTQVVSDEEQFDVQYGDFYGDGRYNDIFASMSLVYSGQSLIIDVDDYNNMTTNIRVYDHVAMQDEGWELFLYNEHTFFEAFGLTEIEDALYGNLYDEEELFDFLNKSSKVSLYWPNDKVTLIITYNDYDDGRKEFQITAFDDLGRYEVDYGFGTGGWPHYLRIER